MPRQKDQRTPLTDEIEGVRTRAKSLLSSQRELIDFLREAPHGREADGDRSERTLPVQAPHLTRPGLTVLVV